MTPDIKEAKEIAERLRELGKAVTEGKASVMRAFTMHIPAQPMRDADLVLYKAAELLLALKDDVVVMQREPAEEEIDAFIKVWFDTKWPDWSVSRAADIARFKDSFDALIAATEQGK